MEQGRSVGFESGSEFLFWRSGHAFGDGEFQLGFLKKLSLVKKNVYSELIRFISSDFLFLVQDASSDDLNGLQIGSVITSHFAAQLAHSSV